MNNRHSVLSMVCRLMFVMSALFAAQAMSFTDDESCLMCHKYPMMGRMTEEGVFRSYFIVPGIFSKTVHRNVPCRDCHNYIKELPHRPVKKGVSCNIECHSINNPATGKPFSHKPIYNTYRSSVHGRDKLAHGADTDKPYCITCHTNPLYNPAESAPPKRIVDRCVVCHEDREFANRWYNHTSRRIREVRRSSEQIVALCSSCHGDPEFIKRRMELAKEEDRELGRKFAFAVESYNESFHGKLTGYGFSKTPNCLDCHASEVNYYRSVHEILPSRDPKSPMHESNRVEACRKCHIYADENYVRLDPHPTSHPQDNPFRYYAELIYNVIGDVVIIGLVGISLFETIGRRRDGVIWKIRHGSSWWRKSPRDRDRIV
ncbi:hypothetical protein QVG61_05875 [Thiohalobacter sp. IOR34]|uniref:hypothetical protein n=1 Tax=Thiohalobacter sp. IOR34 TaxID=3057176 RepID=UPI0025B0B5D7|nr:hypothetical protein [Thiohalobacter sp. IOR34]WJW76617.1 hypothetical protein QVG61_05875 [Thiohalobacter sp. IOR34]